MDKSYYVQTWDESVVPALKKVQFEFKMDDNLSNTAEETLRNVGEKIVYQQDFVDDMQDLLKTFADKDFMNRLHRKCTDSEWNVLVKLNEDMIKMIEMYSYEAPENVEPVENKTNKVKDRLPQEDDLTSDKLYALQENKKRLPNI